VTNRTIRAGRAGKAGRHQVTAARKATTMSTSSNSGPEDRGALSPREREVLAGIEHDLAASDPGLAELLNRRAAVRAQRWRWPLSGPSTGLLVVALTLLALVGTLLPASAWAVLGVVTTLVVIPWLLLAATERGGWD
jgi:hypothetical protein